MAGFMRGMAGSVLQGGKNRLNKIGSSFMDASDQSLFFGSRGQRESLQGFKQDVGKARETIKASKATRNETLTQLDTAAKGLNPSSAVDAADLKNIQAAREAASAQHKTIRGESGQQAGRSAGSAVGAVAGYYAGADRAGQGIRRAGAIGARAGMTMGAGMVVGTGVRYGSGGSFTQNRNGERDIAGIPFV
jgi:hypothetical protein